MISFVFDFVIPIFFFCYALAHLLYKERNIDALRLMAWKAFGLTLPIVVVLSHIILKESWAIVLKRMVVAACIILAIQFFRLSIAWLPRPFRHFLNYFCAAIDDFFAFITFFVLYRRKCWQASHSQEHMGQGSAPILLIHGYAHDAGAWCYLRPRLAQTALGPIFTIDLGSPTHSIEEYARRVQAKADKIAAITGRKELILVGYSMGGLVAAYYALHLASEGSVKGVITIGSPFDGTKMAILGRGECSIQMHHGTPFLRELKQKVAANSIIPFCHICSGVDPIVRPPTSAWLTEEHIHKVIFDDFGHLEMLYSDTIAKTLSVCLHQLTSSERF